MSAVVIANAATAMPNPPSSTSCAVLPGWLTDQTRDVYPELELEMWANAAVAITAAILYAGVQHAIVIADILATSVTNATGTITKNAHGLLTGDGPVRLTTVGGLPAGLAVATDYYVIKTGANTFKLATSLTDALAGTFVALSTDGTDLTLVDTADTQRITWSAQTKLGLAADGAVSLDVGLGYVTRVRHSVRAVAYAVVATLGAAVATYVTLTPIVDVA